jgi:DNA replicative helicase MCM subunit Mcm2 (Cdc46/Mcm family)
MPTTSAKDAKKAIEIIVESLKRQDVIQDDGSFDMEKMEGITPKPKREKKYIIKKVIGMLSENKERSAEYVKVMEELENMLVNVDKNEIDELLDLMKRGGEIYEPKRGLLRVID